MGDLNFKALSAPAKFNNKFTRISQSNRNVRHNGFRRSGGKREYVQARAGPNHRGAQGPRYNQRRPQGQSAEGQYRAGTPVDALNMNFQGDRSAFHKTGRSCTINAAYNGKKFKARGVITEAERQRILAQCPPRSAECKAWDSNQSFLRIRSVWAEDLPRPRGSESSALH